MFEQYAPQGSDLYYILRQVKRPARQAYFGLSAWCVELNYTAERYTEVAISEKKLAWFYEETERFFQGKAGHPLLQCLTPFREVLSKTAMLALIEANALSLKTHIFETRAELLQHYQHLGGIRFALLSSLLGPRSMEMETHLHSMGVVDETLRHLRDAKIFLGRQHLYFAMEDFQSYQIDPQPVLQLKKLESLKPLFEDYFAWVEGRVKSLVSHFRRHNVKPLGLEVLLKLKQAQLMRRDAWQVFHHHVELSPIRKLFLTTF